MIEHIKSVTYWLGQQLGLLFSRRFLEPKPIPTTAGIVLVPGEHALSFKGLTLTPWSPPEPHQVGFVQLVGPVAAMKRLLVIYSDVTNRQPLIFATWLGTPARFKAYRPVIARFAPLVCANGLAVCESIELLHSGIEVL